MRLRVIDFESSGPSPDADAAGLVEVAYTDLVSDGVDLVGRPANWIVGGGQSRLVNPGVPIPPDTSAVHHLVDDDVASAENWKTALRRLIRTSRADGVDYFAAHSAKFEMLWFHPDFWGDEPAIQFLCTYKGALRLWKDAPLHSNQGLRYWRKPVGLERAKALPAHRAGPDSYVTAFLLRDMLNDGAAVEDIAKWCLEPAVTLRCKIGAWRGPEGRGTPWEEVDDGMLHFILDKWVVGNTRDDVEDVEFTVRHHLELRRAAEREEQERRDLDQQLRANGLAETAPPENPLMSAPAAPQFDLPDPNQPSLL